MRKKRILLPIFSLIIFFNASAQDKWDLRRCVEYAWANNISVRQTDIQARLAEVQLNQDKWAKYPSANFSTSAGLQFGRSIDPNTNQFTSGSSVLLFHSFQLQAGVDIFNWHRLKNNVIASQYELQASRADVDRVKNDVALNVATFYLQVLLGRKQADIARVQMQNSRNQMMVTRRKVEAGSLPEVDALSLEGQYANDSSAYITAQTTAEQTLLDLKALLNLDAAAPFDIVTPPVDVIPMEPLLELQPDKVYETALTNQPAQKVNELRLKSLEAFAKATRALKYPSVSIGGGLGSQFSNSNQKITGFQFLGYSPADPLGPVADVGGTLYPILSPNYNISQGKKGFGELWDGWGRQIDNSFRQNIALTIQVPILNGGQARFAYQRAKLNLANGQLTKDLADQTLKNNIYKAYYQATAALQRFNATNVAVTASQKTYDFAVRRHELGLLNTFDLIISQNNLTRAKLDNALAQYDYVFKMKVLEFWKGLGIRL
jgi:outer membrane protein